MNSLQILVRYENKCLLYKPKAYPLIFAYRIAISHLFRVSQPLSIKHPKVTGVNRYNYPFGIFYVLEMALLHTDVSPSYY